MHLPISDKIELNILHQNSHQAEKNKVKFFDFIMPPFIAICSLILLSSSFIYLNNPIEDKEKNDLIILE